jgi:NAD(P)-dependent dehydrogenase (short-subunit alcohol dehydrogenase family)
MAPITLISGAGSGIGRATALLLASRGHRLALVGRTRSTLEQTAALARGAECLVHPADIGDADQAAGAIDAAAERFGGLDALVNNAGYAPRTPIDQHTPMLIDAVFRINSLGPAYTIARAWPIFKSRRRGCIVNISTMATEDPFPGFFAYAAAKAAVNLMARSCATEGREHQIRAFAIAPGAVETAMLRSVASEAMLPADRALPPEAVARVVLDCIEGRRDAENGRVIPIPSP